MKLLNAKIKGRLTICYELPDGTFQPMKASVQYDKKPFQIHGVGLVKDGEPVPKDEIEFLPEDFGKRN